MANFSCKSSMSIYQFAINNNTTSKPGSQCNNHKIFHSFSATINHFAYGSSIGIIGKSNR